MAGLQGNFRITVPNSALQYWLSPGGTQVVDADLPNQPIEGVQWMRGACLCPACGHEWDMIAPVGWYGIECPACGSFDMNYQHILEGVRYDDSNLR